MPDSNDLIVSSFNLDLSFFARMLEGLSGGFFSGDIFHTVRVIWDVYSLLAFALSGLFIYGIIYSYIKMSEYGEIEEELLHEQETMWKELHDGSVENERWHSVQQHLASDNPNDWKLAIIEADVLLERMLDKAGYAGATIGEKLKSASSRSFSTLEDAWQAHRVRNQIAHGGTDFILTQRMAKDTLILYERVFKEFSFVSEEGEGAHHH